MRWPLAAGTSICVFLPDRRVWRREKARREGIGELLFLCCEGGVDVIFMPIILPIFAVKLMLLYPDRDAAHFQLLIALHLFHIPTHCTIFKAQYPFLHYVSKYLKSRPQKTFQFPTIKSSQCNTIPYFPYFGVFASIFPISYGSPTADLWFILYAIRGGCCVCVCALQMFDGTGPSHDAHPLYIVMMMMFYFYCILVSVIVK